MEYQEPIDVTVTPENCRYDPDDERWLNQIRDLYTDLRDEVPGYRVESQAVPGTKGIIESVVLALGSAGAFSAAVTCFKAWLARDKWRRLVVSWIHDGREERIVLEGDAIDSDSMRKLSDAIGRRMGGSEWQSSIGPS